MFRKRISCAVENPSENSRFKTIVREVVYSKTVEEKGKIAKRLHVLIEQKAIVTIIAVMTMMIMSMLSIAVAPAMASVTYKYERSLGISGPYGSTFNKPCGVAADSVGNLYVADTEGNRVYKINPKGNFITVWGKNGGDGSFGSGDGQFHLNYGVATDSHSVDNTDCVYVADSYNNRIQKFNSNGKFITGWGKKGSSNGELYMPKGVAVDSIGDVYVADTYNNRIQKFNSNGKFITGWGKKGSSNGEFNMPTGVAVDSIGDVYVADSVNKRIQKFNSNGKFITKWSYEFDCPTGIAIDVADNVFVIDCDNSWAHRFTKEGILIAKFGGNGSKDGLFTRPMGIAIDPSGNAYVADTFGYRIQKFSPVITDTIPPATALSVDPSAPDGDNGYYKTIPAIILTPNEDAAICYGWDGVIDTIVPATSTKSLKIKGVEGKHTLNFYAVDKDGNRETERSQTFTFRVDSTPPTITSVTPKPSSKVNYAKPIISINYTDTGSGVDRSSIKLSIDRVDKTNELTITETSTVLKQVTNLTPGSHVAELELKDNAGNLSKKVWTFEITRPIVSATQIKAYWAPFKDAVNPKEAYDKKYLSVDYLLKNTGGGVANKVKIQNIKATSSAGTVTVLSNQPLDVGAIDPNGSKTVTIVFKLPPNATRYNVTFSVVYEDDEKTAYNN